MRKCPTQSPCVTGNNPSTSVPYSSHHALDPPVSRGSSEKIADSPGG
jgi:hypothetical protein